MLGQILTLDNSLDQHAGKGFLVEVALLDELVDELTAQAIEALSAFDADTAPLKDYALALAKRNK